MNEVRKIKFTGKNLNDMFKLPCVKNIMKIRNCPYLILHNRMTNGCNIVEPSDWLVEHSDGKWEVKHPEKK